MAAPTLLIADYPIGYPSGFGETLHNLFFGFQTHDLWSAHPRNNPPQKKLGGSFSLPSPARPDWIPSRVSLAFYPALKTLQFVAARRTARDLSDFIRQNSIRNLLVVPVSPWILSTALMVHKKHRDLNLIVFIMDDWQGHHESYGLPFSSRRRRLLSEAIARANRRFAVSREMAAHYEEVFGVNWEVAHNGISEESIATPKRDVATPTKVLLAGDVNVFRFDAVLAFAEALERHKHRGATLPELTILGDVAEEYRRPLSRLSVVKLPGRQTHSFCLSAMAAADLLYLPLAFSQRAVRISLFSLPTKLPEYLASGKPMLVHAPKESAVYQLAERYDLKPRLASIEAKSLDTFVAGWLEGKLTDLANAEKAKLALTQEFNLQKLATTFQSAFI